MKLLRLRRLAKQYTELSKKAISEDRTRDFFVLNDKALRYYDIMDLYYERISWVLIGINGTLILIKLIIAL